MYKLIAIIAAFFAAQNVYAIEDCSMNASPKGCFEGVSGTLERKILVNDRDPSSTHTVDWHNFPTYLNGLLCRCKDAARKEGYTMIGLQFWGECWGLKGSLLSLKSGICDNVKYTECRIANGDKICTGRLDTTFIYQLVENAPSNPSKDCAKVSHSVDGDLLDASKPYVAGSKYCRLLIPSPPELKDYKGNYVIRAEMYNLKNDNGPSHGSGGLLFNVQDIDNFQFAFLRLNRTYSCYETGVVRGGKIDPWFYNSGYCSTLYWKSKMWNAVMIHMRDDGAEFIVNGRKLAKLPNILPKRGRGGIVTRNGEHNVVMFKGYHALIYDINSIV